MVPAPQRILADKIQAALRHRLEAPEHWKSSWKNNPAWRGLPVLRSRDAQLSYRTGRPLLAVLGRDPRKEAVTSYAEANGWTASGKVSEGTALMITPTSRWSGTAYQNALKTGVPSLTYIEFHGVAAEFARELSSAIFRNHPACAAAA